MVYENMDSCIVLVQMRGLVGEAQMWGALIFREQEGLPYKKTDNINTAMIKQKEVKTEPIWLRQKIN